ncbi:16S rRNA (guanine(527)-N(7))-methyltransferase RsmG [Trueperella sp. LYQ141]|uniref:16S rRNA (guanine(527)-N(7))-methyltransferase RsmG n=1 Tax=Trueperella sp. LYQ141 TaxID=3391058 RepID=UPI003982E56A
MTFSEVAPQGGAEHFGVPTWEKLCRFADFLTAEGEKRGLVGPRELDRIWTRHILNSLAPLDFLPTAGDIADVGSGAGFPGIPLAIVLPQCHFDLIDSMDRRIQWLRYVQEQLQLDNVRVIRSRAEELLPNYAVDVVTARAVAALKKLVPWTLPLLKPGGSLVALKGERAELEIDEADRQLRQYDAQWVDIHNVFVWGSEEPTRIVEVRKVASGSM